MVYQVLLPMSPLGLEGATPIDSGYPKQYSPAEMRSWMLDVDRVHRAAALDSARPVPSWRLEQWNRRPATADQRQLGTVYRRLFSPTPEAIHADLLPDGPLELQNGRRRVFYAQDVGVASVPVWVRGEPAAVERLRRSVESDVSRSQPGVTAAYARQREHWGGERNRVGPGEPPREMSRTDRPVGR
jgi:hypothetical protein